jgi:hypothetical protein
MKKSIRTRRYKQRLAVALRLALIGTESAKSHTAVFDKVKDAWTLNRTPLIDRTKQNAVLKPMVKGFSSELVSFAPLFVGYPWCMGIIEPRIGSCYRIVLLGQAQI